MWTGLTLPQFGIDPVTHFAAEQEDLARFAGTGIITNTATRLTVTPQARLLLRAVAMVFDAYKNIKREQVITFSRIALSSATQPSVPPFARCIAASR